MASSTSDGQIREALDLLPETGEVEFDAYKAQLYAANPDKGKEVFLHILKTNLVTRRLDKIDGERKVMLSRKGA